MRTKTGNQNGSKWIRPEKRLAIYLRDGFSCAYCGRCLVHAPKAAVTLDHLKPRDKGGSNHESNLVTACVTCNSSRQTTMWTKFAPAGAVARIKRLRRRALPLELAKAIISGAASVVEVVR